MLMDNAEAQIQQLIDERDIAYRSQSSSSHTLAEVNSKQAETIKEQRRKLMQQEKCMQLYEEELKERQRADKLEEMNLQITQPATAHTRETSSAAATHIAERQPEHPELPQEYYIGEVKWTMGSDGTYRPAEDHENEEEDQQQQQDWHEDQGYDEYGYYDEDGNYHYWEEGDYDYEDDYVLENDENANHDDVNETQQQPFQGQGHTLEEEVDNLVKASIQATEAKRAQQPLLWRQSYANESSTQPPQTAIVGSSSALAASTGGEPQDSRRVKSNFASWITPPQNIRMQIGGGRQLSQQERTELEDLQKVR